MVPRESGAGATSHDPFGMHPASDTDFLTPGDLFYFAGLAQLEKMLTKNKHWPGMIKMCCYARSLINVRLKTDCTEYNFSREFVIYLDFE